MTPGLTQKLLLAVAILCLGLVAAVAYLLLRPPAVDLGTLESQLGNPQVRELVIRELVQQSAGLYDSFHDPMVGKVLLPGLRSHEAHGDLVSTNSLGMREREFAIPKPPNVVRVVLLGDSYIYGSGADAQDRCGVALQEHLQQGAPRFTGTIEVLHLGVPSWNTISECHYVLRQLRGLAPDLVIHVSVNNDLDDVSGVRGFGASSRFSPQNRDRASGIVNKRFAASSLETNTSGFLAHGLDFESRQRYQTAASLSARLAAELEKIGGDYLHVLNWMGVQTSAYAFFREELAPDEIVLMPFAFFKDLRLRVSDVDGHWNAAGHQRVALALYAEIVQRRLLPSLGLTESLEAREVALQWKNQSRQELNTTRATSLPRIEEIGSEIDFETLDPRSAAQIHGGIYPKRGGGAAACAPYASLVLSRNEGTTLLVQGYALPDRSLEGMDVQCFVDEILVATLNPVPGQAILIETPLPAQIQDREFVSVRLQSSDFVYSGLAQSLSVSLGLRRVAIR